MAHEYGSKEEFSQWVTEQQEVELAGRLREALGYPLSKEPQQPESNLEECCVWKLR